MRPTQPVIDPMTVAEHRARHRMLHRFLDELVADFTDKSGGMPSKTSLMDFMKWSHEQTVSPTEKRSKPLKKSEKSVTVIYEGMGTCIAADLMMNGSRICSIGANNPEANELTDQIVKLATKHLESK
jgi:hypothetical protein